TTPIPEVLTYFRSPRRSQPVWELQLALALVATQPVLLMTLVFVQGVLAFAVGSTLIARVLYAASEAPTTAGAYATVALNIGAAAGPALAAMALSGSSVLRPMWVAFVLTGIGLLMLLPSGADRTTEPACRGRRVTHVDARP
ncbi:hypothetical protein AB3M98_28540, partial [Mycolicibacterium litorale]